jgi:hypothetical protein
MRATSPSPPATVGADDVVVPQCSLLQAQIVAAAVSAHWWDTGTCFDFSEIIAIASPSRSS